MEKKKEKGKRDGCFRRGEKGEMQTAMLFLCSAFLQFTSLSIARDSLFWAVLPKAHDVCT